VTETPSPADVLRGARGLIALQRTLGGRTRYLAGAPSPAAPPDPDPMAPPDLFGHAPDPAADPGRSPYARVEALIPEGHPLREMASLDEIRDWLQHTVLVPIDEKRIRPVLGDGDPEAGLMIIGEAPGADEDREGVPFVGRAGQLLNKILEAIHFRREEVYITNILKSRPPGNRDPEPEEVAAHIPVLYKQIALIQPRVLLAVGKTAANSLLGRNSSMATLRGKFHDFHGLPLMVTYHPAALLRNPQWKRPVWEDVKLLRTRYDQLTGGGAA
jgi:DNA polymerase